MAYTYAFIETDPDGAIITVSQLDDSIRVAKSAIRERLEGDPANPLSGIFESTGGGFSNAAIPKAGSARVHAITTANLLTVTKQDGRVAITTDTNKLYHMKTSAIVEIDYLNRDGSRPPTANLPMNSLKLTGLGAGTNNGDSVRYEQAALVDQVRTITGQWTFTRVGLQPFFINDSTSPTITNLDADKLDGQHGAFYQNAANIKRQTTDVSRTSAALATLTDLDFALAGGTRYKVVYDLGVTFNSNTGGGIAIQLTFSGTFGTARTFWYGLGSGTSVPQMISQPNLSAGVTWYSFNTISERPLHIVLFINTTTGGTLSVQYGSDGVNTAAVKIGSVAQLSVVS